MEAMEIEAKPVETPAKAEKKILVPLKASEFRSAEEVRHVWHASIPETDSVETIQKRDYWKHVAGRSIRPGDRIEAVCEDMTWMAELYVVSSGSQVADVKLISRTDLTGVEVQTDEANDLYVKYRGPHHRYCLMIKGQSDPIAHGFMTQDEGQRALLDHRRNVLKVA